MEISVYALIIFDVLFRSGSYVKTSFVLHFYYKKIMLVFAWTLMLMLTVKSSNQECRFEKDDNKNKFVAHCSNEIPESFLYGFFENGDNCEPNSYYSLTITDSKFVDVYSFLPPCQKGSKLVEFSLTNSSVEFIEDWAFEEFFHVKELNLSKNKLSNLSFVSTLPRRLQKLILSHNDFETISNVFGDLGSLAVLDLSYCKISSIDSNSFSNLVDALSLSIRNNRLTSFEVFFRDDLNLDIDVSFNNIEYLNNHNYRRTYCNKIIASHNKIKNISDISCQNCEYGYYRRSIKSVDLSFNNLNTMKLLFSFSGVKLDDLNLSNSNIDSSFDFEILRSVRNTLDLSNNKLGVLTSKTFGANVRISNLILFNSSISSIREQTFNNIVVSVLNISSNFITEVRNYTFINSVIEILDLSKNSIHTIQSKAFSDLTVRSTLNLSNNRITQILRTTFHNLTFAKKIDLSFNSIRKLSDNSFFYCGELKLLDLSNSKIEAIQSNAFAVLGKLLELNLQNNLLSRINFQTSNLRVLNLKNNTFVHFDFSFLSNTSLSVLLLSDNNIKEVSNNSIPVTNPVKEIDLSNSQICAIHVNAFWRINSVEILSLRDNCLEKILPRTFLSLKKLIRLDLSGNKIMTFSKDAFPFGNHLKELGISFFSTNLTGSTFIMLNSLKSLNISSSQISVLEENCFKGLIHLENLNSDNTEIQEIIPGAFNGLNNLEKTNFRTLFKNIDTIESGTFKGLPKLSTLNLTNLQIAFLEPEAFLGLLNLKLLSLNHNKLKKIVNNTFLGLYSLQVLNLSSNLISDLEPQAFVGLVNLTEISLSDNNLTKLLLGTFQEFPRLKILDLHKNGINKIRTGTFSNLKSLTELDLSHNNITKLKMENLMPLTNLTRLELTENNLIQMSHLALIKSLRHLKFVGINGNKWKCDNLATMLIAFQNYSIDWVSTDSMTLTHENIDGIKCYDICKFFYCVEEEERLHSVK